MNEGRPKGENDIIKEKSNMYTQKDVEKAIVFATKKHAGQKRADGTAYIYHPIMVSAILKDAEYGYEYQIAGILHDVLEDTNTTEEELSKEFGKKIADTVKCLTRPKGMNEEEYVEQVLSNRIAAVVKSADKIHNVSEIVQLNPTGKRTAKFLREEKSAERAQKYIDKSKRHYMKRFMPEVDKHIQSADNALINIMMPGKAGVTFNISDMRLYSDIKKEKYEASKKRYPSLEKPDFSREVMFFEDIEYYCVYKDVFNIFGPMKEGVWILDKKGWIPFSYDVADPDDVTFLDKEWMQELIEDKRKKGYFYDFVEFPLIP